MDELINKALESFDQHDACGNCGKRTDGLMTCTYSHDGSTIKLCPDCMEDSGFCYGCGNYCAGQQSFDFSDMPGYCSDCREELKDMFDDDDYDEWDNAMRKPNLAELEDNHDMDLFFENFQRKQEAAFDSLKHIGILKDGLPKLIHFLHDDPPFITMPWYERPYSKFRCRVTKALKRLDKRLRIRKIMEDSQNSKYNDHS